MPPPAKNALDLLMSSKKRRLSCNNSSASKVTKKRGRSTTVSTARSSFVKCPAGCGQHLPNLDYKINQHLDRDCSSRLSTETTNDDGSRAAQKVKQDTTTPKAQPPEKWKSQDDKEKENSIYHHDDPGNNIKVVNVEEIETETSPQLNCGGPTTPDAEEMVDERLIQSPERVDLTDSPTSSANLKATRVAQEEDVVSATSKTPPALENINTASPATLLPRHAHNSPATNYEVVANSCSTEEEDTTTVESEPKTEACSPTTRSPSAGTSATAPAATAAKLPDNDNGEDAATSGSTPSVPDTAIVTSNTSMTGRSAPETPDLSLQDTIALLAKDMEILKNATKKTVTTLPEGKTSLSRTHNREDKVKEIPATEDANDTTTSPSTVSDVATGSPDCSGPAVKVAPGSEANTTNNDTDETSNATKKNPYNTAPKPTPQTNVFAHMMKQSSHVFNKNNNKRSTAVTPDFSQYFVMEYDMDRDIVSLDLREDSSADGGNRPWEPPLWTTTVNVKDKQCVDAPKIVALTLSAVVAPDSNARLTTTTLHNNHQQSHRWVRYHSRLSVPVLKSMLQKSIRRRRPLPAVRVAMELMDKAFGELLRRLPIIVLEDSTLHPDFGLLVWMMVAHSKQFFDTSASNEEGTMPQDPVTAVKTAMRRKLILALQVRILRIVYQIASCPYQDCLTLPENISDKREAQLSCLSKPYPELPRLPEEKNETEKLLDEKVPAKDPDKPPKMQELVQQQHQLQLSIWAMLVRAQYGGMACDVRMLLGFAQVWHDRMYANAQPRDDIHNTKHILPPDFRDTLQNWSQLASHIHATGKEQSISRLPSPTVALEQLNLTDICREGIDFHCSDLVNHLWRDASLVEACRNLQSESQTAGATTNDEEAHLLLKRCIWKYSAGVNLRRPLVEGTNASVAATSTMEDSKTIALNTFWKDVVAPLVTNYQTKYLKERLRL